MSIHIAIPEPTSGDTAYNLRSLPQYIFALKSAGAVPTIIPLHERQDRVARLLSTVQGVLLPGSGFDVDPQSYGETRIEACNDPDPGRCAVDELLFQDAFNLRKPVLAICYGMQALNVWRNGTLVQDLAEQGPGGQSPEKMAENQRIRVDHAPGREVLQAHTVEITPGSRLSALLEDPAAYRVEVNSSHHQAVRVPGDNLKVSAVSPVDGVVEALELEARDHFVLGVQWHPERTYVSSSLSRAIFAAFVQAAGAWQPRPVLESVTGA